MTFIFPVFQMPLNQLFLLCLKMPYNSQYKIHLSFHVALKDVQQHSRQPPILEHKEREKDMGNWVISALTSLLF